jgi:hypothetical protein
MINHEWGSEGYKITNSKTEASTHINQRSYDLLKAVKASPDTFKLLRDWMTIGQSSASAAKLGLSEALTAIGLSYKMLSKEDGNRNLFGWVSKPTAEQRQSLTSPLQKKPIKRPRRAPNQAY